MSKELNTSALENVMGILAESFTRWDEATLLVYDLLEEEKTKEDVLAKSEEFIDEIKDFARIISSYKESRNAGS